MADFDAHIAALKAAGQTGSLPNGLGRSPLQPNETVQPNGAPGSQQ